MNPGIAVPLAIFAAVVIIVALVSFVRLHDTETEMIHRQHFLEMDHAEAIRRLDDKIKRVKAGLD